MRKLFYLCVCLCFSTIAFAFVFAFTLICVLHLLLKILNALRIKKNLSEADPFFRFLQLWSDCAFLFLIYFLLTCNLCFLISEFHLTFKLTCDCFWQKLYFGNRLLFDLALNFPVLWYLFFVSIRYHRKILFSRWDIV